METVLEIHELTKKYRGIAAVDGVTLSVKRGEIYGFLGMNGAGKTTTIRMMLSLARPDSGTVRMFGERLTPRNLSPLSRVGAIVEMPGFYENLTARENLEISARLAGLPDKTAIEDALAAAGLADDDRKPARDFSLGMKQRLGIARAVMHHPELVILDEPANALDPAGIRDIRRLLVSLAKERNIAVFVSSHILAEIEQIADRVGVIHRGRLLEEISMDDLRKLNRTYAEFAVSDDAKAAMLVERAFGIDAIEVPESGVLRLFSGLGREAEINKVLVENGVGVSRISRSSVGLESWFLSLTGEGSRND